MNSNNRTIGPTDSDLVDVLTVAHCSDGWPIEGSIEYEYRTRESIFNEIATRRLYKGYTMDIRTDGSAILVVIDDDSGVTYETVTILF